MKLHLLHEVPVELQNSNDVSNKYTGRRIPVKLTPGSPSGRNEEIFCTNLAKEVAGLQSDSSGPTWALSGLWNLNVDVVFETSPEDFKWKRVWKNGPKQIEVSLRGKLLTLMGKCELGKNLKLQVWAKTYSKTKCTTWNTTGIGIHSVLERSQVLRLQQVSSYELPSQVELSIPAEGSNRDSYGLILSIYLRKDDEITCSNQLDDLVSINQKLIDNTDSCDTVLICENGTEIKCHRSFLFAHSSVLKTMLESQFMEGKTGRIEMSDMTEDSMRAFINYIYCLDLSKAEEKCGIAVDLVRVGDKYDIPRLVQRMKMIFLKMDKKWFSVDAALDLFILARSIDMLSEDVRVKAAKILKTKHKEINTSQKFHQLFETNPAAAKELCLLFASGTG